MTNINPEDFNKLKQEIENYDEKRDEVIRESNQVVKLSKKVIYSVHRKEFEEAQKSIEDMKSSLLKVQKEIDKNPKLDVGAFKVAVQEYVEAICYFEIIKNDKLPTQKDLEISAEYYLLGLTDLAGELGRNAMNSAIAEDTKSVEKIRNFVNSLHDELMQINFRNSELRKKADGIRYEVQKLDNLLFTLKMKK
jgi:translin